MNNPRSDLYKLLTVDQTLHWADPLAQGMSMAAYAGAPVPAVTHRRGGEVPSAFDGYPEAWFTQSSGGQRIVGPRFVSDTCCHPTVQRAGQSSLRATSRGVSKELVIKATWQGDALLVEIAQ